MGTAKTVRNLGVTTVPIAFQRPAPAPSPGPPYVSKHQPGQRRRRAREWLTRHNGKDRTAPPEFGERTRRGRQRIATYGAIQCDINPASEAFVRTGPRPHIAQRRHHKLSDR